MPLTRPSYRGAVAVAATGALAGAMLFAIPAHAKPAAPAATAPGAAAVADRLGDRAAGTYFDQKRGRMVVAVTDASAEAKVREAGAVPRRVKRSKAQLERATATLRADASIPGTAWAVDPATNQVVVSYDSSLSGDALAKLKAVVSRLGDAARLEAVAGTFGVAIAGGDAIYGAAGRCSLGFNAYNGSTYYFLTAGHCGNVIKTWYADSAQTKRLGTVIMSKFPSVDYAIVKYDEEAGLPAGAVDLYDGTLQDITAAGTAYVGEAVRRSGSTTRVRAGTVLALNATVNYVDGTQVTGLIKTNACAEKGDSGGALFDGSTALGLTSGGSGNCTSGGTTYYQPLAEPLAALGIRVY